MSTTLQAHRELVGRQIRRARLAAGLSHDRLAATVGTSRQHLIKLEKGQHLPGEAMIARIADATDKPVEYFESEDDEESDQVPRTMLDLAVALRDVLAEVVRNSNEPSGSLAEATLGSRPKGA